jgi:hypothetical protein
MMLVALPPRLATYLDLAAPPGLTARTPRVAKSRDK